MNKTFRTILIVVFSLAIAASISFWFLQLSAPRQGTETVKAVPANNMSPRTQPLDISVAAGLLGAGTDTSGPSSRITVVGVIAQGGKNQGVALLTVDGSPAMAYRVGDPVGQDSILAHVKGNGIVIAQGGVEREVSLPALPPPTGIDPAQ